MATTYRPGMRVSEYLLEECIGFGTFGEVWRARHHIWEKELVAIKLPTEPQFVRNLQREGVVVHGLRHPNIVRVLGLDPYADVPYLVMELVRGPSLKQLLQEHGRGFPIDVAINVLRGVLRAMVAAHGAGVLHRDLKPGNVLLQLDRRKLTALTPDDVKVVDFGLGHVASETLGAIAQSASLERGDRLVGTLAYLAPELRDGAAKADGRSDLYSIGVILFEMLTGERPAGAELPRSLRPDAPAALDEVFSRLYARADRRYDSAQAALDDLEARLQTTAVPPLPRRAAPPPPPGTIPGVPCPGCGRLVEADDQFCTHCGRQLVSWIRRCPSCMAYPGRHDQYCIFCGANLPALQA